ncbi:MULTISPECIES: acyl-CoA desaturase [Alteromonas]|uniref:Acyl-CoA desaturase n=1 Tax=Alteromonas stellipolaris TaxID=233316 RepID=A0AAW7Z6S9_9ALTE|nr:MULTISPECIES: fatty acid desaturase [Alteromonas]AMJ91948.1 acyl-CoA desaturase [Alteromonas sp. Mac2]AMJ75661.1 acyl-CoA desaturase [Alteromonas stellipolaris]AMJ88085.1 acyl-CoA desaturase [Alteromonas sp. Mac1]AMJ95763.1 acyl-CoA desaturase [Alteromonas stellipolaris]ANB21203.1 acyl-CoA desaturase [Alteromonas stellipolaris]
MNKPPLILTNVLVFLITGAIAFIGVPVWVINHGIDWAEIGTAIFLFYFTGMSITAGYHRLWSHKTYDANIVVRVILAIGGAMALQNSILHWSSDHRIHHRHVDDNEKDPYSAKRGLWFAHIGWMLREYQEKRYDDYRNCKDLQKDKVVMWQHNYYLPIVLAANFGVTGFLGWLNGDILGMILVAGVLRLVLVHHVTFFINSLAHFWGNQPYTDSNTARDNGVLAFFTFGEGYHNYHHIFEYDYRNGIRWYQFDPTKWLIRGLSYMGLTYNLRRVPEERIEKARAAMQLQRASEQVSVLPNAEELMQTIEQEYELLMQRMSDYYAAKKRLMKVKQKSLKRTIEGLELTYKYKELKHALAVQKEKWLQLQSLSLQVA